MECVGDSLRNKLKSAAYPRSEGNLQKRIIPINAVEKELTREIIIQLLNCACEKHKNKASTYSHRSANDKLDGYADKILGIPDVQGVFPAIRILALLIITQESPLILDLIKLNISDPSYEKLSEEYILQKIEGISNTSAQNISRKKWKLFPPVLKSNGIHEEFDSCVIMPFNEPQKLIGSGTYGDVYEVEIHPRYQRLVATGTKGNEPRPKFARKELKGLTDKKMLDIERKNLDLIQTLKNKHLIKVLKSYHHGGKLNFLFPLADSSLHDYLDRKPPETDVYEPYLGHWLWDQLAGIADALASMSSFQEKGGSKWLGYHLDLKPSNILIMGKGCDRTLVITDFGQAYFKLAEDDISCSATAPKPGGFTYSPPEQQSNSEDKINRSFDVWSFGCILLEVAIYIIQGDKELKKFRNAKRALATPGASGITPYFYQCGDNSMDFCVKNVVLERINGLKVRANNEFVNGITELVEDTFKRKEDRPQARVVADRFEALLKLRTGNTGVQNASREVDQAMRLKTGNGDENLGRDDLKDMELKYTLSDGDNDWFDCSVDLQKNKKRKSIKINTRGQEVLSQIVVDQRHLLLIPLYTLDKKEYEKQLGFEGFDLRYRFREIGDMITFQSIITNQNIPINLKVAKVIIVEPKESRISRKEGPSQEFSQTDGLKHAQLRIQLWSSKSLVPQRLSTSTTVAGRTSNTGKTNTQGSLDRFVRVVIYLDVGILVIRSVNDIDVKEDTGKNMLSIKPCKKGGFFQTHMITKIDDSLYQLSGIPTCEDLLKKKEDRRIYKNLTHIEVYFSKHEGSSDTRDFMKEFHIARNGLKEVENETKNRLSAFLSR